MILGPSYNRLPHVRCRRLHCIPVLAGELIRNRVAARRDINAYYLLTRHSWRSVLEIRDQLRAVHEGLA